MRPHEHSGISQYGQHTSREVRVVCGHSGIGHRGFITDLVGAIVATRLCIISLPWDWWQGLPRPCQEVGQEDALGKSRSCWFWCNKKTAKTHVHS